jgi:aspartate 1-decarboxylase
MRNNNKPTQRMTVFILKSKIHRGAVTGASPDYEGSMTIDLDLMEKVGLLPYEKVLCSNMANAARFETYAIPGKRGSGEIVLNGAAAHLGKPGDRITIMSFTQIDTEKAKTWEPQVVVLGEGNAIRHERGIPCSSIRHSKIKAETPVNAPDMQTLQRA